MLYSTLSLSLWLSSPDLHALSMAQPSSFGGFYVHYSRPNADCQIRRLYNPYVKEVDFVIFFLILFSS
eukprot:c19395_g2_i1 orf=63-266(+)